MASETKMIITGLLTSNPQQCTLRQFANDFKNTVGYSIPFRQMGFDNMEDYLRSIPDTVQVFGNGNLAQVVGVVKPKSAHIKEMVAQQKNSKFPPNRRRRNMPTRPPLNNFYCYNHYPPRPSTSYQVSTPAPQVNTPPPQVPQIVPKPPVVLVADYQSTSSEEVITNKSPPPVKSVPSNISYPPVSKKIAPVEPLVEEYISSVPQTIQNNLKSLISQFPEGICCTQLKSEYRKRFKYSLNYDKFKHRSLMGMIDDLPHIFHYKSSSSAEFILYDRTKPLPEGANISKDVELHNTSEHYINPLETEEYQSMNWSMSSVLIPPDVLHLSDEIPQFFPDDWTVGDYLDINIGQIYDLSKFWFYKEFGEMDSLMKELQQYFDVHKNKYKVPQPLLTEGLYCVCLYKGTYHRALIVNLVPNFGPVVRVLYIDYGTVENVSANEIWFMPRKFAQVPTQAVRCRLCNICPPVQDMPWSHKATMRFNELVQNTQLVVELTSINRQDKYVEVYLADITNQHNIFYINDIFVKEGLAIHTNQKQTREKPGRLCVPNVQNIYLYPEFCEIESGNAPTFIEMDYLMKMAIPMHHFLPQYFDIIHIEDLDELSKTHEEYIHLKSQSKLRPLIPKSLPQKYFDFDLFPEAIAKSLDDMGKRDETTITNPPRLEKSETSVKEYSCGKKRISKLIQSASSESSDSGSPLTDSGAWSSSEILPLNNTFKTLTLAQEECPKIVNSTRLHSTNPFLNPNLDEFIPRTSTNPFLYDLDKNVNEDENLTLNKTSKVTKLESCNVSVINPIPIAPSARPMVRTPPGFHTRDVPPVPAEMRNYFHNPYYSTAIFQNRPPTQFHLGPNSTNPMYLHQNIPCYPSPMISNQNWLMNPAQYTHNMMMQYWNQASGANHFLANSG